MRPMRGAARERSTIMPGIVARARWRAVSLGAAVLLGSSAVAGGCRLEEWPPVPATGGAGASGDARLGLGTPVADAELAALDTDVDGAGHGLPPGRGDAVTGAAIYRAKCASCHGARGEGIAPNPPLVGRERREGFLFAIDPGLVKTIGNYWPWAPTLFDYIRRSMPLTAPGSLTDTEVYSLTAWLLAENAVMPREQVLDGASPAAIRMPARDRFVPDDRRGGPVVR